jgi:iron-sulfur cluster assembly protein
MISLTASAIAKIKEMMHKQQVEDGGLRIGVIGGGCSGLSYKLAFETQARPHDQVLELDGLKVFIDPKSSQLLSDTTVDFSDGLNGRGFVFINPQATRTCGCGSSFSI